MNRFLRFLRSWYRQLVVLVLSVCGMARAVTLGWMVWGVNDDFLDSAFRNGGEGEVMSVELAAQFAQHVFVTGMVVGGLFATSVAGFGWVCFSACLRRIVRVRREESDSWNYGVLERIARNGKSGDVRR